jgi:periplasmic protein TonB
MANPNSRKRHRYLPMVLVGLAVVGVGGGAVAYIRSFLTGAPPPSKKVVQEVHLIRPPPPPPDEPPPPPPPPEEKVEVPDPQQKPDPTPSNDPPPSEQLGLDAEGTAGGDSFGLVGNKGGRELTAIGGNAFAWYEGLVKGEVLERLNENNDLRRGNYRADIRLEFGPDGTVMKVHILKSSGDSKRDRVIESLLDGFKLSKAPPAELPPTISLSIVRHG